LPIRLEKDPDLYPTVLQNEEEADFDPVSILHGRMLEAYQALPARLRHLSEFELCAEVDPGPSEYKMRQNFSDALETARKTGRKFRTTTIFENVVARQTFFDLYMKNELKVAFITRPVVPHHAYYDALHKEGLRKLFLYVKNHDLDPKTMATFARIVEKAGDRVVGAVAQQINMNQKQLVHHTKAPGEIDVTPDDPQSMQLKIQEMQTRLNALTAKDIDVTPG
jgi:hypothetical protein